MRKLDLNACVELDEDSIEYKLPVWKNQFRFRIIGEKNCLASVTYGLWDPRPTASWYMDYTFHWVKDRETAVRLLNEFISKMINDWKTFIWLMRKYEIYDK